MLVPTEGYMDDGIEAAKRLLANYTAQRQPCTAERQEAAEALLGELGKLNRQFGWEVISAEHILEVKFKRTPPKSGRVREACLRYDTSQSPPKWLLTVQDSGLSPAYQAELNFTFNLFDKRFETSDGGSALLAVVEQVVEHMDDPSV